MPGRYGEAHNMVLQLVPMDNALSRRVMRFIDALRAGRFVFPEVRVCVRTQPAAAQFMAMLVEDKARGDMSYAEMLCMIHKQIQTKVRALY